MISSVSHVVVLKQKQTEWEQPGRIFTVSFQYWQIVASRWKLGDMHAMPLFVVPCYMLVKVKVEDIHQLARNNNTMIKWICSPKLSEEIPAWSKNSYGYFKNWRCCQILPLLLVWPSLTHGWRKMAQKDLKDNIRSDLDKLWLSTSLAQDHVKWKNAIKPSRYVVGEKRDVKLDSD